MASNKGIEFLAAAEEIVVEVDKLAATTVEIEGALPLVEGHTPERLRLYGLVALVESFYTGAERALQRANGPFGADPGGDGWHRRLLERSALALRGELLAFANLLRAAAEAT